MQEKTQYINRKYKRDRLQRNKYCEKYRVKKCNKSQKKAQDIKRYRSQKSTNLYTQYLRQNRKHVKTHDK